MLIGVFFQVRNSKIYCMFKLLLNVNQAIEVQKGELRTFSLIN